MASTGYKVVGRPRDCCFSMTGMGSSDLAAEDCLISMTGMGSDLEAEDCCLYMPDASVEHVRDPDYGIHLCESNFAAAPRFASDFVPDYHVLAPHPPGVLSVLQEGENICFTREQHPVTGPRCTHATHVFLEPEPVNAVDRQVPGQARGSCKNQTGAHSSGTFTLPCSRTVHLQPSRSKRQAAKRANRKSTKNHPLESTAILQVQSALARI